MIFGGLALFSHMTVAENVAYGLTVRDVSAHDVGVAVTRALAMFDLTGMEDLVVDRISWDKKTRVALARAIVLDPAVVLIDEPLSQLDDEARRNLEDEITRLHQKLGTTWVIATYLPDLALGLSDRIAVLRKGRLAQVGGPREVFENPADAFVAKFMGFETLLRPERLDLRGAEAVAWIGDEAIGVNCKRPCVATGRELLAARSSQVFVTPSGHEGGSLTATVCGRHFRGSHYDVTVALRDGQRIVAAVGTELADEFGGAGTSVRVGFASGAPVVVSDDFHQ